MYFFNLIYLIQIDKSLHKIDLLDETDLLKLEHVKKVYEQIGYQIKAISLHTNEGIEEVKSVLQNKTTLLSGHSGVGKSTFINMLFPEFELRTQDVS